MFANVFPQNFPEVHYKFDLKGASINRREMKSVEECVQGKTCRDLDFFRYSPDDKDGANPDGIFRQGIVVEAKVHEWISNMLENDTWVRSSHSWRIVLI